MFEDVNSKKVFSYFEEISFIPRGSGNEKGIADYLVKFAKDHNIFCSRDEANNVFMKKEASVGYENHAPIMLQGHIDMVCEANGDVEHDFLVDPIKLVRNGDILSADGTTLGADDGTAVAVMLAILDSSEVKHPPLECLFTAGEEIGMVGMKAFDASQVKSRKLINLDSLATGVATVACAGGVRTDFTAKYGDDDAPSEAIFYRLIVSGLSGGHSGEDINLGRTNAIVAAVTIMRYIIDACDAYIVRSSGGDKDNAIPRECSVEFAVTDSNRATSALEKAVSLIKSELTPEDKEFKAELVPISDRKKALSSKNSRILICALSLIHSGPIRMSDKIPGFVETSSNFSIWKTADGVSEFTTFSRSSVDAALDNVITKLNCVATSAGADVIHRNRYKGWAFAEKSEMRDVYLSSHRRVFNKEAGVEATHAGLECGVLLSKIPDMDIVSIGPDIKNLHSPSETVSISSFDKFYDLVVDMLKNS